MKQFSALFLAIFLGGFIGSCRATGLEDSGKAIKAIMENPAEFKMETASKGERVLKIFKEMQGNLYKANLQAQEDSTLKLLGETMPYVCLFRTDKDTVHAFEQLFRELESRGLVSRENAGYLQLAYIDARMFKEAGEMHKNYPQYDLNFIPEINDSLASDSKYRVFSIDPTYARLTAESVPETGHGAKVIFVGSIFCNICSNAVSFIEGNDRLKKLSGEFLALSNNFVPKQLAKWNSEHNLKYRLPYASTDWTDIDLTRTPGVYFMQDGKVQHRLEAWDIYGGARLADGLYRIGLVDFNGYVETLKYTTDRLVADKETFEDRVLAGRDIYNRLAPKLKISVIKTASPDTLETAFFLIANTLLNNPGDAPMKELGRLFVEMERRGQPRKEVIESMYDYFLDYREFKSANKLAAKYPGLNYTPIPELTAGKGPTEKTHRVYDVKSGGTSAELTSLTTGNNPMVIVTGIPTCGATKRALSDIEKNPTLRDFFSQHAIFITWNSYFRSVAAWNKNHATKAYVAYLKSDWPEFEIYSSPVFYFIKDGKITASARGGWGDAAGMAEKLKGIKTLGVDWEAGDTPAGSTDSAITNEN